MTHALKCCKTTLLPIQYIALKKILAYRAVNASELYFDWNVQNLFTKNVVCKCLKAISVGSESTFLRGVCYQIKHASFVPVVYALSSKYSRANFNPVADVVEQTAIAVVKIQSSSTNSPFRSFGRQGGPKVDNSGSGFIIQADGLILTNAHVVNGHSDVIVTLHDGSKHKGFVQTVDPVSDLATVQIEAADKKLPILPLGLSDNVRPGEYVIAIGSPLTLSNTVTHGIISTAKRKSGDLGIHGKCIDYIQTDALITFGNSGGPLVNMDGEAIGVNSMTAAAGISFAIPSDYVKIFLDRAKTRETRIKSNPSTQVAKRFIGVTMMSLTPNIIAELKVLTAGRFPSVEHGVLIQGVVFNGPAHRAGIVSGCIITHVNGQKINTSTDVYDAVDKSKELSFTMLHKNERFEYETITVNVQSRDVRPQT